MSDWPNWVWLILVFQLIVGIWVRRLSYQMHEHYVIVMRQLGADIEPPKTRWFDF